MDILAISMPLLASFLYVFFTIYSKKAMQEGVGIRLSLTINTSLTTLLLFLLHIASGDETNYDYIHIPIIIGAICYFGHLFNFISIKLGDVTLQVSLLGIKTTLVTLILLFLGYKDLSLNIIIAALLSTVAVFLLGFSEVKLTKALLLTIILVLVSNLFFALGDCSIEIYSSTMGVYSFLATLYATITICSIISLIFKGKSTFQIKKSALKLCVIASIFLSIQSILLCASMGIFKIATQANIIYSLRGIWSILIVYMFGKFFNNTELKSLPKKMLFMRIAGAIMLVLAVIIIFV